MYDAMKCRNLNNKNTFNILTTPTTIHRNEQKIKLINNKTNNDIKVFCLFIYNTI